MIDLFDEPTFGTLRADLGDADAAEALTEFLADTAAKMAKLSANCESRPLIKLEAHSIKSSAGVFGFNKLSQLARELEASAETADFERLGDFVRQTQQAFEATRQFAQAHLLGGGCAMGR